MEDVSEISFFSFLEMLAGLGFLLLLLYPTLSWVCFCVCVFEVSCFFSSPARGPDVCYIYHPRDETQSRKPYCSPEVFIFSPLLHWVVVISCGNVCSGLALALCDPVTEKWVNRSRSWFIKMIHRWFTENHMNDFTLQSWRRERQDSRKKNKWCMFFCGASSIFLSTTSRVLYLRCAEHFLIWYTHLSVCQYVPETVKHGNGNISFWINSCFLGD